MYNWNGISVKKLWNNHKINELDKSWPGLQKSLVPFPVQCRRNYPCRALRPHYSFSLHILLSSTRNCRTASRRLSNRNEDGFLIRGHISHVRFFGREVFLHRGSSTIPPGYKEEESPGNKGLPALEKYVNRRKMFLSLSLGILRFIRNREASVPRWMSLNHREFFLKSFPFKVGTWPRIRNPLNWFQWVFWHFCQAAPINYMIYDEKNRTSLTWGGPVFYHARGSYFLFRQWKFMGNTPFPNDKLVMCLEKI